MATPGAVTSGLMTLGLDRSGPRELKAAIRSPRPGACSRLVPLRVACGLTAPASHARSAAPSFSLIIVAGSTCVSATTLAL